MLVGAAVEVGVVPPAVDEGGIEFIEPMFVLPGPPYPCGPGGPGGPPGLALGYDPCGYPVALLTGGGIPGPL